MSWPAHKREPRRWSTAPDARAPGGRRPPREDRELREITVGVPPLIAELEAPSARALVEVVEAAQIAAVRLDAIAGEHLVALSGFLLRSESVASSKIERIDATPTETARAFAGLDAGLEARTIAASARAVTGLIDAPPPLTLGAICSAHQLLLKDDRLEGPTAGRVRQVQNWIGGSDFSPRNADYVPPPADLVGPLMDDLVVFARRPDLGAIAQAAIVHAQFESIHPFTDGNGRVGRALINTVLRHRGVTRRMVIPVASVLLADVDAYFSLLERFRAGDAVSFIRFLAEAVIDACDASTHSSEALRVLPDQWREDARPRTGSSAMKIIDVLAAHPVLTANSASDLSGTTVKATLGGLAQLEEAGVLTEITGSSRDRVWLAHDVIDELDRLSERIGRRARPRRR